MARGIQVFPSFIIGATGQGLIDSSLTRKRCNAVATQRLVPRVNCQVVLFWSILSVDIVVFLFCFSLLFIPWPVNWRNEMTNDFGDDQWWWNQVNLGASAIIHFSSVKFLFVAGCVLNVFSRQMCAAGNIPDDWIVKGKKKPFSLKIIDLWNTRKAIAFLRYGQVVWGLWTRFSLGRNRSPQVVLRTRKNDYEFTFNENPKMFFSFFSRIFVLDALSCAVGIWVWPERERDVSVFDRVLVPCR